MNVKNGETFDQIISPAQGLFEKLDHQIKETKKMMSDIKQKWFNALDKQHQVLTLNEKIIAKLDKVNDV